MVDKVRALIVQSQFIIYRYAPDESYLPPPAEINPGEAAQKADR